MARNARPKPIAAIQLNAATQGGQREDAPDVPPDGGYGCVTFNSFTWGVTLVTASYFQRPSVRRAHRGISAVVWSIPLYISLVRLFPEARSLDYGFIGGFNFAFAMLLAPLATYLTRKFGKRSVLLCGCVLQCSDYVEASFAK